MVTYRARMRGTGFIAMVAGCGVATAMLSPVSAAVPAKTSANGAAGQVVTVSRAVGLNPSGQLVTVTGRGFNPRVGIYVALCRTPTRGVRPGPCGGGVDMDGSSQSSAWVSSNPPPYGRALAQPYRPGGRFTVRINVASQIGDVDCRVESCAIVTRADHLRINDRSADVVIPVKFQ